MKIVSHCLLIVLLLQQSTYTFFANTKPNPHRKKLQEIGRVDIEFSLLFHGIMHNVQLANGTSKDRGYVLIEEQNQAPPHDGTFYVEQFTAPMSRIRRPVGNKYQDLELALRELESLAERA